MQCCPQGFPEAVTVVTVVTSCLASGSFVVPGSGTLTVYTTASMLRVLGGDGAGDSAVYHAHAIKLR